MDITIPEIVRPLDLKSYADELEGMVLQVWVNPPRKLVLKYAEIRADIAELKAKLAELRKRAAENGQGAELDAEIDELDSGIEAMTNELFAWFAEIWSKGHHQETMESVKEFATAYTDTDPQLWAFVTSRTVKMIRQHREGARKN